MSNLPTNLAPKTLAEAIEFSKLLSDSTMIPANYRGKPSDILVAVQYGAELGLHPMQAMQNIACINGKPSIFGDAAIGIVKGSGICEDIEESIEGSGDQTTAICVAKRKGSKPVVAKFSVQDAKRAGLWGKTGPWSQYPARMLQMRARGFALRDAFPDVLKGLITVEEARDYPVNKSAPRNSPEPVEKVIEGEVLPPETSETIDPEIAQLASEQHVDLVANLLFQIDACETMDCLKEHYAHAMQVLKDDKAGMKQVYDLKNAVKARIDAKIAEDAEEL